LDSNKHGVWANVYETYFSQKRPGMSFFADYVFPPLVWDLLVILAATTE